MNTDENKMNRKAKKKAAAQNRDVVFFLFLPPFKALVLPCSFIVIIQ